MHGVGGPSTGGGGGKGDDLMQVKAVFFKRYCGVHHIPQLFQKINELFYVGVIKQLCGPKFTQF